MLYDGTDFYFSKNYLMHIVDRVGGGGFLRRRADLQLPAEYGASADH